MKKQPNFLDRYKKDLERWKSQGIPALPPPSNITHEDEKQYQEARRLYEEYEKDRRHK